MAANLIAGFMKRKHCGRLVFTPKNEETAFLHTHLLLYKQYFDVLQNRKLCIQVKFKEMVTFHKEEIFAINSIGNAEFSQP